MAQRFCDFPSRSASFQDQRHGLGSAGHFPAMLARGLPIAVVGELIVTGEGYQHPETNAQGEAHLGGSIDPHLSQPEMGERETSLERIVG